MQFPEITAVYFKIRPTRSDKYIVWAKWWESYVQLGGTHLYLCAPKGYTNHAEGRLGTLTGGALQQSALWSIRPPRARTSATPQQYSLQHVPAPTSERTKYVGFTSTPPYILTVPYSGTTTSPRRSTSLQIFKVCGFQIWCPPMWRHLVW